MRVLFVTQYGLMAASSRTRVFQFLPYLSDEGISHHVITVLPDSGLAGSQLRVTQAKWRKLSYYLWAMWRTCLCGVRLWKAARYYDVLFVQKVIFPSPIRWLLRRRLPPTVFDFDDAIFTTEVRQRNWLAGWKERRNAAGLPAMLRLASLAVVENDYTAAFAACHCPHVETITGPIDTRRYHPGDDRQADVLVLGWVGSASTLPYLETLRPSLERLCRRFSHLRLHVVGADIDWGAIPLSAKVWTLESEVDDLQAFDIGLMPVPDDPWTRGKGGYKLLQYMALGLPVVSSPVGVNREIVADGESGFWAVDAAEWEDKLATLIEDANLRRRMGRQGRRIVEERFSLDIAAGRLARLLLEMGGDRAA
jgi:glycosyltransferase involved in cell wall biosynthesis